MLREGACSMMVVLLGLASVHWLSVDTLLPLRQLPAHALQPLTAQTQQVRQRTTIRSLQPQLAQRAAAPCMRRRWQQSRRLRRMR